MKPNPPLTGDYENQEYDSFVEGEPAGARRRSRPGIMPTAAPVPIKSQRVTDLLQFLVVIGVLSLLPQSVMLAMSFINATPAASSVVQAPGLDLGWTEWVEAAACSQSCGGGVRKVERERNCTSAAAAGCGSEYGLLKEKYVREITCNIDPCSGPIDGGWGPWTCTNGTIARTCTDPPPAHGGKLCQGPVARIQAANRTGFTCAQDDDLHTAYKISASYLTKPACESWCTSMGAEIPTVLTQEENEETQRYNPKNDWMWLAATKSGTERSSFKWDGGEEWKWPTEEGWTPTWFDANAAGQKCLKVYKDLQWADYPCTSTVIYCLCRV